MPSVKADTNKTVAISGGFDPLTIGHVRYIQEAAKYGDVVVILNTDSWLVRKKGYSFMKWNERAEILRAIRGVKNVVMAQDFDDTVRPSLKALYPDCFAKGGDRTRENTPELAMCIDMGIEIIWNCGGEKISSSQELVDAALDHKLSRTAYIVVNDMVSPR